MNLFLNTAAIRPPLTGIGVYTISLAAGLLELAVPGLLWGSRQGRLVRLDQCVADAQRIGSGGRSRQRSMHLALRVADSSVFLYLMHKQVLNRRLSRLLRSRPITVYHEPQIITAPFERATVTTVHDCSVLRYPRFHPRARVRYFEREFVRSLEQSDRIVVPSDVVRSELIETFSVSPQKVRTIYHGPAPSCAPAPIECLEETGLVHDRFVLCMGTLEPRKNLSTLLAAWESLPDEIRRKWPLVICGARGWHDEELADRIRRMSRLFNVRYLGYVSDRLALRLLRSCSVFVYPSIYEGFGLPVLAAMRQGAPSIVGDQTAMAEYGQTGVQSVDVQSADRLASEIQRLLGDRAAADSLRARALQRSLEFDWRTSAREHLRVYQEAGC